MGGLKQPTPPDHLPHNGCGCAHARSPQALIPSNQTAIVTLPLFDTPPPKPTRASRTCHSRNCASSVLEVGSLGMCEGDTCELEEQGTSSFNSNDARERCSMPMRRESGDVAPPDDEPSPMATVSSSSLSRKSSLRGRFKSTEALASEYYWQTGPVRWSAASRPGREGRMSARACWPKYVRRRPCSRIGVAQSLCHLPFSIIHKDAPACGSRGPSLSHAWAPGPQPNRECVGSRRAISRPRQVLSAAQCAPHARTGVS